MGVSPTRSWEPSERSPPFCSAAFETLIYFASSDNNMRQLQNNDCFKRSRVIRKAVLALTVRIVQFRITSPRDYFEGHGELVGSCCPTLLSYCWPNHYVLRGTIRVFLGNFLPLVYLRGQTDEPRSPSFFQRLCLRFQQRVVFVEGDRVYALLRLLFIKERPQQIIPDYDLSTFAVYLGVTSGFVERTLSLLPFQFLKQVPETSILGYRLDHL